MNRFGARNGDILNIPLSQMMGSGRSKDHRRRRTPRGLARPRNAENCMALRRGVWRNERLKSFDQIRNVTTRNFPCPAEVNLKIFMDHNIPEAHDFSPRDLRMGVLEFGRDALGRFTEHSTLKQHGVLVPAAVEEVQLLQPTCVFPYLPRRLKHIEQERVVTLHTRLPCGRECACA